MTDQTIHTFILPRNTPVYIGRLDFVIMYSKGKDVLHLGCVDEGLSEQKVQRGLWLHEHLLKSAKSLWGVDVNREGIEWMRAKGIPNLYLADIEELDSIDEIFSQKFDLILLTEVLEHVDNPGKFLKNVRPLFRPGTEMLVTVPNVTSLTNLIENWQGRERVHPDHNYWFSMHTIQSLFNKFGYSTQVIGLYSQHNYRRPIIKSLIHRLLRVFTHEAPHGKTPSASQRLQNHPSHPGTNWRGVINAIANTLIYRFFLSRNPFFADGLIIIARTAGESVDSDASDPSYQTKDLSQ